MSLLVCALCEVTPPCPCGGTSGLVASALERWYDPQLRGTVAGTIDALDGVAAEPPALSDVVEVAGHALGRADGPPWIALVGLRDGRWCYLCFTSQITGELFWTVVLGPDRRRLWWFACTDEDRERFTRQLTLETLEEELVQIDELLESRDPAHRALGERRMLQRHARRGA